MLSRVVQGMYGWVDTGLNYGREEIAAMLRACGPASTVVDIGAGSGADLASARAIFPSASLVGFDCGAESLELLRRRGVTAHRVNIECDAFPLEPGGADIVIANQVLEHTKEIFWIFHQVARSLSVGGHLVLGVPNLASLHNRILLACGRQPTAIRSASAHVRGFTRPDVMDFLASCWPGGFELVDFRGSNFYPFPPLAARPLARALPSLAWANFYLLRKTRPYDGSFVRFPGEQQLETNFFTGAQ